MLIIRRRGGESFRIGNDVEVEILEVSGAQVKIGIKAPREVPVLRSEVYLTILQNQSAAASAAETNITEVLTKKLSKLP